MVTRLYFHQALNGLSNLPTTEQSSLTANGQADAFSVNRLMDTTIGTAQQSLALTSNATVSLQRYYFTCFVSAPLSGISSITAQTWTYNYAAASSISTTQFPANSASSVAVRITCYVWRPSTQTKVGDILDGTGGLGRGTASERSHVGTFTGALVSSVQDGDVICFEVWFEITQSTTSSGTDSFYYDGTTVNATNFQGVTNHASFIETPQNLTFGSILTRVSLSRTYKNRILVRLSTSQTYKNKILGRVSLSRVYKNKIAARVSLTRIYKNKIRARVSLSRIYQNKIRARVSLSRIYKNRILTRVSLTRIYKNKIRARVSLSRIYKNKVLVRISLSRIYKNKIRARVSLTRIYKNKIRARVSLSRIYKNRILNRISLTRIYKNRLLQRLSLTRIYQNRILNKISLSRIYKNKIQARISLTRSYKNKIRARVSLTRVYKNKIVARISLIRVYKNKIRSRVSLSRIYKNRILSRVTLSRIYKNRVLIRVSLSRIYKNRLLTRLSLTRIYKNKIVGRVSLSRVYKNRILNRISLSRIYKNKLIQRISLSRTYKNRILNRISLSRIYKNKILKRVSLVRIYKNRIFLRVSLSRIYKNRILKRVSLSRIYKNRILNRISLSRIYKNRILTRISLTRIYKNKILLRVSLSRIYKNKIVARVSLTRKYVNKIIVTGLTRISLDRTYKNKITARVSNPRVYKNRLLQRVSAYSIFFDGIDDSITIGSPTILNNLDNFTISMWVYPSSLGTSTPHLFVKNYSAANSFILYFSGAGLYNLNWRTVNNALVNVTSTSTYINTTGINRWYHILLTFNRTTGLQQLYVDNVVRDSDTNTGVTANTMGGTAVMTINGGGGAAKWGGMIKDFRVFKSELSPSDINKVYLNMNDAPTPDYWLKMEERTGNPIDTISGSLAGTLVNGARWVSAAPDSWIGRLQVYKNRLLQRVGVGSIFFDGVDDQVDCKNDATLWSQPLTKFSWSIWVYAQAQGGTRYIINHGQSGGGFGCYQPSSSTDRFNFRVFDAAAGTHDTFVNLPSSILNRWVHLVAVYDSTLPTNNLKIYGDNVLGTGGSTFNLQETLNLSTILLLSSNTADFQGYAKDFRWYTNKALTPAEISDIYNNLSTAPVPNYWLKMNEITGNPIDSISGTKTATLLNGARWKAIAPDILTGMIETYKNKIAQRISLSQTYVNRLLQRVGAYAISLDGVNDYIDLGSDSVFDNLTNGFTWTFWILPTLGGTAYRTIVRNQTYPSPGGFELWYGGATPSQRYLEFKFNLNGTNYFQGQADIGIGAWGLCAISWDNIAKKSYIKFASFSSLSGTRPDNQIFGVGLGLQISRSGSGFAGNIKDIRFFRSALTVAQINDIENNVSTLIPDYWQKLDEGTGSPIDTITEIKTATLVNGAKWTFAAPNILTGKLQVYKNKIFVRVSLSRIYKNKIFGRISLDRIYKNRIRSRVSVTKIYKNRIFSRISLSRIYKNKIRARVSLSRIYKNKIAARISLSRVYKNRILIRVSLPRIYKNKILSRISLSRIYKNRLLQKVGAYSLFFDGINDYVDCGNDASLWSQSLTKFSFSCWFYPTIDAPSNRWLIDHGGFSNQSFYLYQDNNSSGRFVFIIRNAAGTALSATAQLGSIIVNRWNHITCVYDNSLGSANLKMYVNGVIGSSAGNLTEAINISSTLKIVSTTQTPFQGYVKDFRWFTTKALTQQEVNNIYNNSPSAPIPNYWLEMDDRTGNPIDAISGTKTGVLTGGAVWKSFAPDVWLGKLAFYKNRIFGRVSLSRIYRNRILSRISLTRVYQNRIMIRVSISRIYRNKIFGRVSLSRIYRNRILNKISLTRVYRNKIRARVSRTRIYKNKIRARVSLSRIYKNRILQRVSLTRIYRNLTLNTISMSRIYKNRILVRVSLSRTYINRIIVVLSRVSLERTYINKIQARVSLSRIYINVIEKAKKEVRKGFGIREKIPRTTSFLRGWYDRTTNR